LVDTNLLRRLARRSDPYHKFIDAALAKLSLAGTTLHYTHQNIAELWNVMTRPAARNGFGLTAAEWSEVRAIEVGMSFLAEVVAPRRCIRVGFSFFPFPNRQLLPKYLSPAVKYIQTQNTIDHATGSFGG
jgi:hypothetical protein